MPLAIAAAAGPVRIPRKVALAGAVLAMAPDSDVAGFAVGVDYAADWGHRGASHSLVFAGLAAAVLAALSRDLRGWTVSPFLFAAMASHGLLDMLTDGGLGVALWWPFDSARLFWPLTPVRVSPIGAGFFSSRGLETLLSEVAWIWLPCALLALAGLTARRTDPLRDPS